MSSGVGACVLPGTSQQEKVQSLGPHRAGTQGETPSLCLRDVWSRGFRYSLGILLQWTSLGALQGPFQPQTVCNDAHCVERPS